MTSDSNPPEVPGVPESPGVPETSENAAQSAVADAKAAFEKAGFSTPEGMVAFGSLILLGGWAIFHLIMNRGAFFDTVGFVLAAVAVAIYFGRAVWTHKIAPRPVLLKALGYTIAVLGALQIVWLLRFISGLDTFREIIQAIVFIAGYVVTYMGARAIKP